MMKFPKSVHPEGWLDHIDNSRSEPTLSAPTTGAPRKALNPRIGRPSAKIRATDPLGYVAPEPLAAAVPPIGLSTAPAVAAPGANPERRSSNAMPWVLGVGAGVVLIGVAVTMSRQSTSNDAPVANPIITGEATLPAPAASSPEDVLLAEAPPAAGTVTPEAPAEPAVATPPADPAPQAAAPAPKLAETPKPVEAPRVARAAPEAPVTRTLQPEPQVWTTAQASPPPATLREPTPVAPITAQPTLPPVNAAEQPVAPVAPPPVTETPPVAQTTPLTPVLPATQPVQPATPPVVVAQTPPMNPPVVPPTVNPEDTGITIKVREALATDSTLAAVPIAVSTAQGVVKLEGQAPDAPTRERATVLAAATSGVRGVDNRLTLPPVTLGALTQNSGS